MYSRIVTILTAVVLALGVSAAGASSSAAAGSPFTDCPTGYSCQWRDGDYTTAGNPKAHFSFFACEPYFNKRSYGGYNGDNSTSSVSNNGRYDGSRYYVNALYGSSSFALIPGSADSTLFDAPGGGNFNDVLSSAKFTSYSNDCR